MQISHKEHQDNLDADISVIAKDRASKNKNWRVTRFFRSSAFARSPRDEQSVIEVDHRPTRDLSVSIEFPTKSGGGPTLAILSFLAFVVLPFLASAIYFTFLASDQYVAEARFAVRSLAERTREEQADDSIVSMTSMPQDSYIVASFIHSSEILERLSHKIDYRGMFTGAGIDFLSRFDAEESKEEFLDYWKNQITTYIDGPSGIITLRARAFTPEDATKIAQLIIEESESLINELSVRAQQDMTRRFSQEVEKETANYRRALDLLNDFQNKSGLLTPEARATETGTLLTGLLAEKLNLDSRLFVLKQSNVENSPAYQQLALHQRNIEQQIEQLRRELAGGSAVAENMASSIKTYARLETDRRVAESLYEASRKNMEIAQAEALRKALYIVVFVPPNTPQDSIYPHRISTPLLLLLALSVAWMTIALIWASVEDHRL